MSDTQAKMIIALVLTWITLCVMCLIFAHWQDQSDARITVLEQSQCSIKQERQHADYKLNVCIAQLRSKP